jgi:hypothetical protein
MSGDPYHELLARPTYQRRRILLVGPIAFAVTGTAMGICWAMLYRYEPTEHAHVYLDESIPPAFHGAVAGLLVGAGVAGLCIWRPGLRPAVTVLAATLLCGSAAAPLGWIVGDSRASRRVREDGPLEPALEPAPRAGMAWAAASGAVIGLGIGLIQWLIDRHITASSRRDHRGRPEPGGEHRDRDP